jgi:hypothetical protein
MELLGIRVQRNFCSLGGGSTRKEVLWREYIYRSCLNGCVVRVGACAVLRGNVAFGQVALSGDSAGGLARVLGCYIAVASGGHWVGRFVWIFGVGARWSVRAMDVVEGSVFKGNGAELEKPWPERQ